MASRRKPGTLENIILVGLAATSMQSCGGGGGGGSPSPHIEVDGTNVQVNQETFSSLQNTANATPGVVAEGTLQTLYFQIPDGIVKRGDDMVDGQETVTLIVNDVNGEPVINQDITSLNGIQATLDYLQVQSATLQYEYDGAQNSVTVPIDWFPVVSTSLNALDGTLEGSQTLILNVVDPNGVYSGLGLRDVKVTITNPDTSLTQTFDVTTDANGDGSVVLPLSYDSYVSDSGICNVSVSAETVIGNTTLSSNPTIYMDRERFLLEGRTVLENLKNSGTIDGYRIDSADVNIVWGDVGDNEGYDVDMAVVDDTYRVVGDYGQTSDASFDTVVIGPFTRATLQSGLEVLITSSINNRPILEVTNIPADGEFVARDYKPDIVVTDADNDILDVQVSLNREHFHHDYHIPIGVRPGVNTVSVTVTDGARDSNGDLIKTTLSYDVNVQSLNPATIVDNNVIPDGIIGGQDLALTGIFISQPEPGVSIFRTDIEGSYNGVNYGTVGQLTDSDGDGYYDGVISADNISYYGVILDGDGNPTQMNNTGDFYYRIAVEDTGLRTTYSDPAHYITGIIASDRGAQKRGADHLLENHMMDLRFGFTEGGVLVGPDYDDDGNPDILPVDFILSPGPTSSDKVYIQYGNQPANFPHSYEYIPAGTLEQFLQNLDSSVETLPPGGNAKLDNVPVNGANTDYGLAG
jgi:hypothetical protein